MFHIACPGLQDGPKYDFLKIGASDLQLFEFVLDEDGLGQTGLSENQ